MITRRLAPQNINVPTSHTNCCYTIVGSATRNSAIAVKPRDSFGGQSRSAIMVPFHMLGMVSC